MEIVHLVIVNFRNSLPSNSQLFQGSRFLKFVLEAARVHFAEANFENLTVPERFGPTFFTTTFVSVLYCFYIRWHLYHLPL